MGAQGSCSRKQDDQEEPTQGFSAGKAEDYEDDETLKEVWITDEISVLVSKYEGKFYAIGSKCPHYGAPLAKGVLKDGTIKCPWHGACFDITTGDIEDFPGLDCLPTFQVKVKKNQVMVYANPKRMPNRIIRPMVRMKDPMNVLIILGAGPAGLMCAQTLRQEAFNGRIIMITKDKYLPYDRPKLSKAPGVEWKDIKLRDMEFFTRFDIEVMLDTNIGRVNLGDHKIYLASNDFNEFLTYDKIVLACGMKPRMYGPTVKGSKLKNIVTCSNLDESMFIGKNVGGKKVLIIGSSFVAMELASAIKDKVESLTILSRQVAPYGVVFGEAAGKALLRHFLTKAKKAKYIPLDEVKSFEGNAQGEVTQVITVKNIVIPCDLVIVAIGAVPNTHLFDKTGLKMHDIDQTIICNKYMETNYKHTYAIGDVANFPIKIGARDRVSVGHWQVALTHGRVCALNIMEKEQSITDIVPFFWTSLCGVNIRYTGYGESYDTTAIYGDMKKMEFCVVYSRNKKLLALLAVGCDPLATQMASALEDQDEWEQPVPEFISQRFPGQPIEGDIYSAWRPRDDAICAFDLKESGPAIHVVPEEPPPPKDIEFEEFLTEPVQDPLLPGLQARYKEILKDQAERRKQRTLQRNIEFAKSKDRLKKFGPPNNDVNKEKPSGATRPTSPTSNLLKLPPNMRENPPASKKVQQKNVPQQKPSQTNIPQKNVKKK